MLKISVITVSYNAEKFLDETINSVLSQSYPNIEYIIIDGNSSDNTVSIIRKYEDKITRWLSEKDRGMFDALNKGIALATGDVIGMLHTDDFYPSTNVIEKVAAAFEQSDAEVIYGDLEFVHPYDTDKVYRKWKGMSFRRNRFLWGWMPAHTTFYVKKNTITRLGEYRLEFKTAADYELMMRYLYKHNVKACYLPILLVKMRTGGVSNNNIKNRIAANRNDLLAMKANGIPFPFIISLLKPLSKLHQYLFK